MIGEAKKAAVVAKALNLNGGNVTSSSVSSNSSSSSSSSSTDATNAVVSLNDIVGGGVVEKQRKYHLVLDENGWETLVEKK
jgi:hypothetical protein